MQATQAALHQLVLDLRAQSLRGNQILFELRSDLQWTNTIGGTLMSLVDDATAVEQSLSAAVTAMGGLVDQVLAIMASHPGLTATETAELQASITDMQGQLTGVQGKSSALSAAIAANTPPPPPPPPTPPA
jgi:hypothetical protein